jgi:PHD/YefM family antitoxin component YafN of YafNO toxin-antitoxin module
MEACNTKELRDNLKSFLDKVTEEGTVRINRNTETFIIMKSDEYIKMKEQIIELQNSVISLLSTVGNFADQLPSPKISNSDDQIHEGVINSVLNKKQKRSAVGNK